MDKIESLKEKTKNIFSNVLGLPPLEISHLDFGVMNVKFKVVCFGQSFVIRYYLVNGNEKLKYEPFLLEDFYQSGVKVPKLSYTSASLNIIDTSFIIYEWVDGITLNNYINSTKHNPPQKLLDDICSNLMAISDKRFTGYGDILNNSKALYESNQDFLKDVVKRGIPFIERNPAFYKYNLEAIENFCANFIEHLSNRKNSSNFIWTDFSLDNIIVKDNRLAAFIDFEHSLSGDVIATYGYFYARYFGKDILADIFSCLNLGLLEISQDLKFYAMIRLLRLAEYTLADLPNGQKRDDLLIFFPGIESTLSNFLT